MRNKNTSQARKKVVYVVIESATFGIQDAK